MHSSVLTCTTFDLTLSHDQAKLKLYPRSAVNYDFSWSNEVIRFFKILSDLELGIGNETDFFLTNERLLLADICLSSYAVGELCKATVSTLANQYWIKNQFRNEK